MRYCALPNLCPLPFQNMKNTSKLYGTDIRPSFSGWVTIPALILMLLIMQAQDADALTPQRVRGMKVQERRLQRIQQHKRQLESAVPKFKERMESALSQLESSLRVVVASLDKEIEEAKRDLCLLFQADEYCEKPPEPVSTGHTKKISFDVRVSFYNAEERQTDHDPRKGAWGHDIVHFLEQGDNPVAASRDIAEHPLGKLAKIKLVPDAPHSECAFLADKTFTVMDKLSDCTQKNRDLRTGRCVKKITNQIDVLIPCMDEDCFRGRAKANGLGICKATLIKL